VRSDVSIGGTHHAQIFEVPINAPIVAGRYYWRAVSHDVIYATQTASGTNVKSTAPPAAGGTYASLAGAALMDDSFSLPLSMTVRHD
jgi:hypothetical protein